MNLKRLSFLNGLIILLMTATFISCSDDDTENVSDNVIVGTWQWTLNEVSNCPNPQDNGIRDFGGLTDFSFVYTFRADGTVMATVLDDDGLAQGEGTYTLSNGTLEVCFTEDGDSFCDIGEIDFVDDNTFKWSFEGEDSDCDSVRQWEKI